MRCAKPNEISREEAPSEGTDQLEVSPDKAFGFIQTAKKAGMTIVPLIGAGLSAESGIPMTSQLIDYFANVKAMIDIKYQRRQRRQGTWSLNILEDDPPSSVYHDYLLRAGWPEPNQLNIELLVEYEYALNSSSVESVRKVAEQFCRIFAEPAGNTLGGMRLWAIHGMLRRSQPAFMKLFKPDAGHTKCPVGQSVDSMIDTFLHVLNGYVEQVLHPALAAQGIEGTNAAEIERLFKDQRADDGLTRTIFSKMRLLRGRALRNLSGDWRTLMRTLTLGNPALADSLFDRLVHRPGEPSPGHELLALLTESLGWKLWLTTNFDNLIEEALRDQGIEPTVFELADNGPAPDAILFRDTPSVVKLHGGAFGLRVDDSLDVPLDSENLGRFVNYVGDNAFILVLGYGGGDRRVMSLIDHLARRHTNEELPKILWVSREEPPKSLIESSNRALPLHPIKVVNYRSGGYFLRELHARLVERHPTSRTSYPALPMVPPLRGIPKGSCSAPESHDRQGAAGPERIDGNEEDSDLLKNSVVVFKARHASEALLDRVQAHVRMLNGYNEIWYEFADVATVRDMLSSLFDEFRRLDPDVTPRALQLASLACLETGTRGRPNAIAERAEFLAGQFAAAMRRGKYLVAILSTGDLGRHPFAHDLNDKGFERHQKVALDETMLLYAFLERLLDDAVELGASKLLVALSPLYVSRVRAAAMKLFDGFPSLPDRRRVVDVPTSGHDEPKDRLKRLLEEAKTRDNADVDGTMSRNEYVDLLVIASTFRRPRSFINLRGAAESARDLKEQRGVNEEEWKRRFELMLQAFDDSNLLIRIEGGFLWMPSAVRDLLNRQPRPEWLRSSFDEHSDQLHERIALQYDDLLRQSNSISALLEVAYHLVTAMRLARDNRDGKSLKQRVLRKLCAILDRSRPMLQARPSRRVCCWLQALEDQLRTLSPSRRAPRGAFAGTIHKACDDLRDLRADVLYRLNDYERSLEIRQEQIDGPVTSNALAVKVRRAQYTLEQGRCLARRCPEQARAVDRLSASVEGAAEIYRARPEAGRQAESEPLIREAKQIEIESHVELAQLFLRRIHTWEWIRRPAENERIESPDDQQHLKSARDHYNSAQELIARESDLCGLGFTQMHVRIDLTRARLRMIETNLTDALRALDDAHAAATVGDGPGDRGDLTDIRLQAAETLIFAAAYAADARVSEPGKLCSEVKAKLDQAGVALKQARSTLMLVRPDPDRWARMGLISAYLQYERVLLEGWRTPNVAIPQQEPVKSEVHRKLKEQELRNKPPLDSRPDTLIQQGLNALGSMCELCWHDSVRRNEVLLLWLRFLIAYHFFRQKDSSNKPEVLEELEDWLRWNKSASLDFIDDDQWIRSFCESVLGAWWPAASSIEDVGATRRLQLINIEKRVRPLALGKLHRRFEGGIISRDGDDVETLDAIQYVEESHGRKDEGYVEALNRRYLQVALPGNPRIRSLRVVTADQPDGSIQIYRDPRYLRNARTLARQALQGDRVVGGKPVPRREMLDCVSVGSDSAWACSGTLIGPNVVLTAGRCADHATRIGIGHDVNVSKGLKIVKVSRLIRHEQYHKDQHNDLMVLLLEQDVDDVEPRRLATGEMIDAATSGRVAGFGNVDAYGTFEYGRKRYVDVPVASNDCRGNVDGQDDGTKYGCDPGLELIAGRPLLEHGSCTGDSGGPFYISFRGKWLLAGATSRATDSPMHTCGDGRVYVRVDRYRKWIEGIEGVRLAETAG